MLGCAGTIQAQESTPRERYHARPFSMESEEFRLMRMYPSEFNIPAFRRYDMLRALNEQRGVVIIPDEIIRDASEAREDALPRRGGAELAIPLEGGRREGGMLKDAGMFVLRQVLGFGYQYFRESTRKPTLTDFDYLELPQGTGVLRSFNEVEREALLRSEQQSRDVHEDRRESGKRASGK
jgi:hypothetical protein